MQSEEEIQRYTLSEDLTETERITQLLAKSNTVQQSYVFFNAFNIFREDPQIQA